MVLGCEAELVDELLRVLTDASCGLHGEGNEVSELSGSDFLVLDLLESGRLLSDCEDCGATCRDMKWTERVRAGTEGRCNDRTTEILTHLTPSLHHTIITTIVTVHPSHIYLIDHHQILSTTYTATIDYTHCVYDYYIDSH